MKLILSDEDVLHAHVKTAQSIRALGKLRTLANVHGSLDDTKQQRDTLASFFRDSELHEIGRTLLSRIELERIAESFDQADTDYRCKLNLL